MTQITAKADLTLSGYLASKSTSYATARAGGTIYKYTGQLRIGQYVSGADYWCHEGFLSFPDTAVIPGNAIIDSVRLRFGVSQDQSVTDFRILVSENHFYNGLDVGDWKNGAFLPTASGYLFQDSNDSPFDKTDTAGPFRTISYVNNGGPAYGTQFMLWSLRQEQGYTPTQYEFQDYYMNAVWPELIVDYHLPAANPIKMVI